jgi:hypothetical protein
MSKTESITDLISQRNRYKQALERIGKHEPDAREMVARGFHNTTLAIDLAGIANEALNPPVAAVVGIGCEASK